MDIIKYTSDWTAWVSLPKTPSKSQPLDDSRSHFKTFLWKPNLWFDLSFKDWFDLNFKDYTLLWQKMKVQRKYQNATFWIVSPKLRDLLADYNAREEVDLSMARRTYQKWINYGFTWERKKILEELIFTWATQEICLLQWDPFFSCWERVKVPPHSWKLPPRIKEGTSLQFHLFNGFLLLSEGRLQGKWRLKFFFKIDTFESRWGKLQLGPTGKLSSFSTKGNNASLCNGNRFHQSAVEESTAISYTMALRGQAAELYSLTPRKGSSEHSADRRHFQSFLLFHRDWFLHLPHLC